MPALPSQVFLTVAAAAVALVEFAAWMRGDTFAGRAVLLLSLLTAVFAVSAHLRVKERRQDAALVASSGLLLAVPVFAVNAPDLEALVLLAPIAFTLAVPHVRGRALVGLAAGAVMMTVLAVVANRLPIDRPAETGIGGFTEAAGAAMAAVLLVALVWRSHRNAEISTAQYAALVANMPVGIARDAGGRFVHVNRALADMLRYPSPEALRATPVEAFVEPDQAVALRTRVLEEGQAVAEMPLRRYDGTTMWARIHRRVERDRGGNTLWFDSAIHDITAERREREVTERLAAIVESASDAIFSLDRDGHIQTWNATAERIYGWPGEEMAGLPVSMLAPEGEQEDQRRLLAQALGGERVGPVDVLRRRRSGDARVISLTLSPLRDADGHVVGASAIARDLTEQRVLEQRLERWRMDRETVVRALYKLTRRATPEATAAAVCDEVTRAGFHYAAIVAIADDAPCSFLAFRGLPTPAPSGGRLAERTDDLRARARLGSWVEAVRERDHGPLNQTGIHALAYVPIQHDDAPIALLVTTAAGMSVAELEDRLAGLLEFAAIASPLLAPALRDRHELGRARARITDVIEGRRFSPVFQPIVSLGSGVIAGYEALTRFEDGTRPDIAFAEAHRVGLGLQLEAATLDAALEAAAALPRTAYLDLNVSPELVLAGEPLRGLLASVDFAAVLEITEHTAIADYAAFRRAFDAMPGARLAVDDAGAGFASLRHIAELRPSFIKLDQALVRGIDANPARAAIIRGLVTVAGDLGATLVAEGVETAAERDMLRGAGVRYGQGYLLGRPAPATREHPGSAG